MTPVRIELSSIFVEDQARAERFYTEMLGLVKKNDLPVGEARWLTLVSPSRPEGPELVLEPNGHPAARAFQEALKADGIPLTALATDDLQAAFEAMQAGGVEFTMPPTDMAGVRLAIFDDTCGNLIQLYQQLPADH